MAFVEDPDAGRSYGAHRCDLLAEAVVGAFERGVVDRHGRLDLVRARFAAAGISPETPYLGGQAAPDLRDPHLFMRPEDVHACR